MSSPVPVPAASRPPDFTAVSIPPSASVGGFRLSQSPARPKENPSRNLLLAPLLLSGGWLGAAATRGHRDLHGTPSRGHGLWAVGLPIPPTGRLKMGKEGLRVPHLTSPGGWLHLAFLLQGRQMRMD